MALSITFKRWRCLQFTSKMALFTVYFKDGAAYSGTEKMARLIVALKIRCCLQWHWKDGAAYSSLKRWSCSLLTSKMALLTVALKRLRCSQFTSKMAVLTVCWKDGANHNLPAKWRNHKFYFSLKILTGWIPVCMFKGAVSRDFRTLFFFH